MKNTSPTAGSTGNKSCPNFERYYRVLEYLRKHTDREHTVNQSDLRKVPQLKSCIRDKGAFNNMINTMADTLNHERDSEGMAVLKPPEEWTLIFDAYEREFRDFEEDLPWLDSEKGRRPIRNLYYQSAFSPDEINILIEGVLFSRTVDTRTARDLVRKVEDHLTNIYYQKFHKNICTVYEPALIGKEQLSQNLRLIQEAIDRKVQIRFRFHGYDYRKQLEPVRKEMDQLSPYYLVADNGRYYVIGSRARGTAADLQHSMSIWRVDLMKDMEIARDDRYPQGVPVPDKSQVANLPQEWDDSCQFSHLNMSFDKPVTVTLRIYSPKQAGAPDRHVRPDYTFLHDWFGDTFRFVQTDKEDPDYDIVRVKCSPYGIVNWALQYSDRVEILGPEKVRAAITEKVKCLKEKYKI